MNCSSYHFLRWVSHASVGEPAVTALVWVLSHSQQSFLEKEGLGGKSEPEILR